MAERRILFAVHDWGLGHASRSLVLIRALIERGDAVTVLMQPSDGLDLLKRELGDTCEFYHYRGMPKPFSRWPIAFYVCMSLATPWILLLFILEHRLTERLIREFGFDLVVSDSRFGVWSRTVPSYCIFHCLRQIIPGRPNWLERLVEWGQRWLLRHYRKVLVPDAADNGGLAGDLAHDLKLDWGPGRVEWIGPLADVGRDDVVEDVDYFFSISGIEPHRSLLEKRVFDAIPQLSGRIVVTLGRPDADSQTTEIAGATVYGYLGRERQAEMLNRARVIMTRSGYTTLMELATLGKHALFVPTPGLSEQEYLARFHREHGHVWSATQNDLDIPKGLARVEQTQGLPRLSSADSVSRFLRVVS